MALCGVECTRSTCKLYITYIYIYIYIYPSCGNVVVPLHTTDTSTAGLMNTTVMKEMGSFDEKGKCMLTRGGEI